MLPNYAFVSLSSSGKTPQIEDIMALRRILEEGGELHAVPSGLRDKLRHALSGDVAAYVEVLIGGASHGSEVKSISETF